MAAVDDSTELPPMLRGASRRGRRTYGISVPQRRSRRLQKSLPEYGRLPSPRRRRSAATEQTEPSDVAKPVSVSQARALAARRLSQVRRGVTRYTGFGRTPKAGREQGKEQAGQTQYQLPTSTLSPIAAENSSSDSDSESESESESESDSDSTSGQSSGRRRGIPHAHKFDRIARRFDAVRIDNAHTVGDLVDHWSDTLHQIANAAPRHHKASLEERAGPEVKSLFREAIDTVEGVVSKLADELSGRGRRKKESQQRIPPRAAGITPRRIFRPSERPPRREPLRREYGERPSDESRGQPPAGYTDGGFALI